MKRNWDKITSEDVKEAIELFDRTNENYPEPRNTFLVYNGKKYPAKHIRGLSYYIAHKEEISKTKFNGGQETSDFFKKLNFDIQYQKSVTQQSTTLDTKTSESVIEQAPISIQKKRESKKLNPVDQKNALQLLLQKHFGIIETEKKFNWLKTPKHTELPKEYEKISVALFNYRNQNGFKTANRQLLCDIVLENQKLIIEYDENQHFSAARQITLENYPDNIHLHYSKNNWIESCKKINAKDNSPIDRDEKRAFYDSVRDIEAFKHGYKLIRIKHGDTDWLVDGAELVLKGMIEESEEPNENKTRLSICTAVIQTESSFSSWDNLSIKNKITLLERILHQIDKNTDILVLPAGFFLTSAENLPKFSKEVEKHFIDYLDKHQMKTTICFGFDGEKGYSKIDQLGYALNKSGVVAKARKFHHMNKSINLAGNAYALEGGYKRFFTIKNKKCYLAVCYDLYGINKHKLQKEDAPDLVLGMIHGFDFASKGSASEFARKGMAGAAKQWGVYCYSSATFADKINSDNWPSGIEWKHGNESVKNFKYGDIRIEEAKRDLIESKINVSLRYFNL